MRQYGNLSFVRTYQAGHAIPSYQPETAYKVFTRALYNLDIATGSESTAGNYTSKGRDDPDVQLKATPQDLTYCYVYALDSCYDWQRAAVANGTAEICNWIFVDANSTALFPEVIARCRAEQAASEHNQTAPGSNHSHQLPEFEGGSGSLAAGTLTASTSILIVMLLAFVM